MSSKVLVEPPTLKDIKLTYPRPNILLITLDHPKSLNCLSSEHHHVLDAIFAWFDAKANLNVAIITGNGRAFCAGADLKEWNQIVQSKEPVRNFMPETGFGGLSRRSGKKPVIAAVNGLCYGGGCEMIINADIVIADEVAQFALSEAKIGVVALAGALPRLVRTVGKQRAMEMTLTGRVLAAAEAREWGLVNHVVKKGECVQKAIQVAESISANSPDSVIVSREGIKMAWEGLSVEEGTRLLMDKWYSRMDKGDNMKEGLKSFTEKRKPNWVPSKL